MNESPPLRSWKMSEISREVDDDIRGLAFEIGFGEEEGIDGDSVVVWWVIRVKLDVLRLPGTIVE